MRRNTTQITDKQNLNYKFLNEKNVNLWGVDSKEEWAVHDNIIIEKDLNKYPDVINETNKKFDVIISMIQETNIISGISSIFSSLLPTINPYL